VIFKKLRIGNPTFNLLSLVAHRQLFEKAQKRTPRRTMADRPGGADYRLRSAEG
jgi:hypothetical protein